MRILSWNINGIRTLPQYHPWNSLNTCEGILDELKADIICFQEMKSSRAALTRDVALPGPFDSFFSFPLTKSGYSGVAVYYNSRKLVALKAEEGLSGKIQPKPAFSPEEYISTSYPSPHTVKLFADEDGLTLTTFEELDVEGRGLVVDFGLFVLINVYCPNETTDTRLAFKMNYHLMLEERVKQLIAEGREVIVLGDLNICATPLDHCDGHLPSSANNFWEHPARAWLRQWLDPVTGPMVDVLRTFWPDRKGMYTCWNTKISARETNYGTRIDYILVTRGLLPWVKHGDIQPSLKGSDHCPIFIDLHDQITLESGGTVQLREVLHMGDSDCDPPRLAARFWDEFSGRQTLLSTFFNKRDETQLNPVPRTTAAVADHESSVQSESLSSPSNSMITSSSSSSLYAVPSTDLPKKTMRSSTMKRKVSDNVQARSKKKRQLLPDQTSITSFFRPPISQKLSSPVGIVDLVDNDSTAADILERTQSQLDADYRLACELSVSQESEAPSSSQDSNNGRAAWSSLFAPLQPPKCIIHSEPAKQYKVNKPGPNKGKTFFLCSRPVGPGWDKGKNERLRDEVDHRYRCNFFKWATDVKRESLREQSVRRHD